MFNQRDTWTTLLVIFVSMIAVQIGFNNLQWGLNTVVEIITQMETRTHK
jgi:hypothetical protein